MILRFTSVAVCAVAVGLLASAVYAEGRGVRTPEAVQIFNDVCAETYPSFKGAEQRALALGFTVEQENPAKDLWISAFTNTKSGRSGCSVQFGTVETVVKLIKNLELLGKVTPTGPYTATVQFQDTPNSIYIRLNETRKNGRIVVQLRLELN